MQHHLTTTGRALAITAAVRARTRQLIRSGGVGELEREDVEQALALHVLLRWRLFDPGRATARTFADRVARSGALNLLEARRAKKRGAEAILVGLDDAGLTDEPWPNAVRRLDVARVVEALGPDDQRICWLLGTGSVSEAADALGMHRSSLRRRITKLRSVFEAAGLRAHLEAA